MSSRSLPEEPISQLPAGASGVVTARTSRDRADAVFQIMRNRREEEDLAARLEERRQKLESLHQRKDELLRDSESAKELVSTFDVFLKDQDADQAVVKAEKVRKEVTEKEAELKRLEEESAELTETKQELLHQLQRNSPYQEFMQRVVEMTKFEDVHALEDHLESVVHIREQLRQKENEAQEQADRQRKALLTLEDQHRLLLLHRNNRLTQIQTDLEKTRSKAEVWERKWNHIQETAAKKTLLLGLIKMATLNLYELTGGEVEGEEGVAMNDTETQLEKMKIFLQDHGDIVKQQAR